jgi:hypothetical protein
MNIITNIHYQEHLELDQGITNLRLCKLFRLSIMVQPKRYRHFKLSGGGLIVNPLLLA